MKQSKNETLLNNFHKSSFKQENLSPVSQIISSTHHNMNNKHINLIKARHSGVIDNIIYEKKIQQLQQQLEDYHFQHQANLVYNQQFKILGKLLGSSDMEFQQIRRKISDITQNQNKSPSQIYSLSFLNSQHYGLGYHSEESNPSQKILGVSKQELKDRLLSASKSEFSNILQQVSAAAIESDNAQQRKRKALRETFYEIWKQVLMRSKQDLAKIQKWQTKRENGQSQQFQTYKQEQKTLQLEKLIVYKNKQISELNSELQKLNDILKSRASKSNLNKNSLDIIQKQCEFLTNQNEDLKKEVGSLKKNVIQLGDKIREYEEKQSQDEEKKLESNTEIELLKEELNDIKIAKNKENKDLIKKIDELVITINKYEQVVSDLENQKNQMIQQIKAGKESNQHLLNKFKQFQEELVEEKKKRKAVEIVLNEKKESIIKLKNQQEQQSQKRIQELNEQLMATREEFDMKQKEQNKKILQTVKEKEQIQNRLIEVSKENELLRDRDINDSEPHTAIFGGIKLSEELKTSIIEDKIDDLESTNREKKILLKQCSKQIEGYSPNYGDEKKTKEMMAGSFEISMGSKNENKMLEMSSTHSSRGREIKIRENFEEMDSQVKPKNQYIDGMKIKIEKYEQLMKSFDRKLEQCIRLEEKHKIEMKQVEDYYKLKVEHLESELKVSNSQLTQRKKQLSDLQTEIIKIQDTLNNVKVDHIQKYKSFNNVISDKNNFINELTSKNKALLQIQLQNSRQSIDTMQQGSIFNKSLQTSTIKEVEDLKQKKLDLQIKLNKTEEHKKSQTMKLNQSILKISELQSKIKVFQENSAKIQQQRETMKKMEITIMNFQINEQETEKKDKEKIEEGQTVLAKQNNDKGELEALIKSKESLILQLKTQLLEEKTKTENYQKQINYFKGGFGELELKIKLLEKEIAENQQTIEKKDIENREMASKIESHIHSLDSMDKEMNKIQQSHNALIVTNSKIIKQEQAREEKYQQSVAQLSSITIEKNNLNESLQNIKQMNETLNSQNTQLKQTIQSLTKQNTNKRYSSNNSIEIREELQTINEGKDSQNSINANGSVISNKTNEQKQSSFDQSRNGPSQTNNDQKLNQSYKSKGSDSKVSSSEQDCNNKMRPSITKNSAKFQALMKQSQHKQELESLENHYQYTNGNTNDPQMQLYSPKSISQQPVGREAQKVQREPSHQQAIIQNSNSIHYETSQSLNQMDKRMLTSNQKMNENHDRIIQSNDNKYPLSSKRIDEQGQNKNEEFSNNQVQNEGQLTNRTSSVISQFENKKRSQLKEQQSQINGSKKQSQSLMIHEGNTNEVHLTNLSLQQQKKKSRSSQSNYHYEKMIEGSQITESKGSQINVINEYEAKAYNQQPKALSSTKKIIEQNINMIQKQIINNQLVNSSHASSSSQQSNKNIQEKQTLGSARNIQFKNGSLILEMESKRHKYPNQLNNLQIRESQKNARELKISTERTQQNGNNQEQIHQTKEKDLSQSSGSRIKMHEEQQLQPTINNNSQIKMTERQKQDQIKNSNKGGYQNIRGQNEQQNSQLSQKSIEKYQNQAMKNEEKCQYASQLSNSKSNSARNSNVNEQMKKKNEEINNQNQLKGGSQKQMLSGQSQSLIHSNPADLQSRKTIQYNGISSSKRQNQNTLEMGAPRAQQQQTNTYNQTVTHSQNIINEVKSVQSTSNILQTEKLISKQHQINKAQTDKRMSLPIESSSHISNSQGRLSSPSINIFQGSHNDNTNFKVFDSTPRVILQTGSKSKQIPIYHANVTLAQKQMPIIPEQKEHSSRQNSQEGQSSVSKHIQFFQDQNKQDHVISQYSQNLGVQTRNLVIQQNIGSNRSMSAISQIISGSKPVQYTTSQKSISISNQSQVQHRQQHGELEQIEKEAQLNKGNGVPQIQNSPIRQTFNSNYANEGSDNASSVSSSKKQKKVIGNNTPKGNNIGLNVLEAQSPKTINNNQPCVYPHSMDSGISVKLEEQQKILNNNFETYKQFVSTPQLITYPQPKNVMKIEPIQTLCHKKLSPQPKEVIHSYVMNGPSVNIKNQPTSPLKIKSVTSIKQINPHIFTHSRALVNTQIISVSNNVNIAEKPLSPSQCKQQIVVIRNPPKKSPQNDKMKRNSSPPVHQQHIVCSENLGSEGNTKMFDTFNPGSHNRISIYTNKDRPYSQQHPLQRSPQARARSPSPPTSSKHLIQHNAEIPINNNFYTPKHSRQSPNLIQSKINLLMTTSQRANHNSPPRDNLIITKNVTDAQVMMIQTNPHKRSQSLQTKLQKPIFIDRVIEHSQLSIDNISNHGFSTPPGTEQVLAQNELGKIGRSVVSIKVPSPVNSQSLTAYGIDNTQANMKKNVKFNQVNSKPIINTTTPNLLTPNYKYSSKPITQSVFTPTYQVCQSIPQSEYFDKNQKMKSSKQKIRQQIFSSKYRIVDGLEQSNSSGIQVQQKGSIIDFCHNC